MRVSAAARYLLRRLRRLFGLWRCGEHPLDHLVTPLRYFLFGERFLIVSCHKSFLSGHAAKRLHFIGELHPVAIDHYLGCVILAIGGVTKSELLLPE